MKQQKSLTCFCGSSKCRKLIKKLKRGSKVLVKYFEDTKPLKGIILEVEEYQRFSYGYPYYGFSQKDFNIWYLIYIDNLKAVLRIPPCKIRKLIKKGG